MKIPMSQSLPRLHVRPIARLDSELKPRLRLGRRDGLVPCIRNAVAAIIETKEVDGTFLPDHLNDCCIGHGGHVQFPGTAYTL